MTLPSGFGEVVERLRRSTVLVEGEHGGSGSGIIVHRDGTVVTNAHVARSRKSRVQLWDGRRVAATLRARDPAKDLALLAVSASELQAATFGDSDRIRVGELVLAVGNPFGFLGAVTAGVVHGVGSVRGLGPAQWIQCDLRLAPGNSGGPLADASGNVIGLNAMIVRGLALAIPGNMVGRFAGGSDRKATLGIVIHPVEIAINGNAIQGLVILEVLKGSPAERASLMPGDIVVGLGGSPLYAIGDLEQALSGSGERVLQVEFIRGDRKSIRKTTVLLEARQSRAA